MRLPRTIRLCGPTLGVIALMDVPLARAQQHAVVPHARPRAAIAAVEAPVTAGLASRRPLRGTLGMPIIAGTFADVTPKFGPAVYDSAFFGVTAGVGPYSVARYYREVSLGTMTFLGATTPWIRLTRTRASYVDGDAGTVWQRYGEFARDLLQRADALVDWRRYDNDGPDGVANSGDDDGAVDIAVLLQPGSEYGCGPDSLRGFRETGYRLSLLPGWNGEPFVTSAMSAAGRPIVIDDFVGASAVACEFDEIVPTRVNIPIHEIGHVLGLPDLYDYDGSSFGVGGWDVMGIFAAPPARPPHFGAWARDRLGWASTRHVTTSGRVELRRTGTHGDVVRIDFPGSSEHVLLEYRAGDGADASAPATGLVIWQINDAVLQTRTWGVNDDETRPAVRLVQADGRNDLAARANIGDAGDPFPGSSEVISISDTSSPWLRTSDGTPTGVRIDEITVASDRVSFDVTFTTPPPVIAAATTNVNATLGQATFVHALAASGGAQPYQWRALDPLPNGFMLTADGVIEGAPAALTDASVRVELRDANGSVHVANVVVRVTMPAMTLQQALSSVARPGSLDEIRRRALDLIGNRNGRVDIGDAVRFKRLLEAA
ncbi:MAG: M6 family metalloprotease domain-containing protein, partial [Gemmatimonadota bacterium]|nr:M6 family metalloprotease domain-containing protein [Gemmatimonadota bacterium]